MVAHRTQRREPSQRQPGQPRIIRTATTGALVAVSSNNVLHVDRPGRRRVLVADASVARVGEKVETPDGRLAGVVVA